MCFMYSGKSLPSRVGVILSHIKWFMVICFSYVLYWQLNKFWALRLFPEYINFKLHVSRQVNFPTSLIPTSKWIVHHPHDCGWSGIHPSRVELRLVNSGLVYLGYRRDWEWCIRDKDGREKDMDQHFEAGRIQVTNLSTRSQLLCRSELPSH